MSLEPRQLSLKELEARMRPGMLSQGGFLGEGEHLADVLAQDARTLAELGLGFEELAARLGTLIQAAMSAPHHTALIGHLEVEATNYMGFQMCPWSPDIHRTQCTAGGGVQFGSMDWCIRNLSSGQKMCGPGLIVHLIRDHHFFEGRGSPYRVEPYALAHLLELGPFSP